MPSRIYVLMIDSLGLRRLLAVLENDIVAVNRELLILTSLCLTFASRGVEHVRGRLC